MRLWAWLLKARAVKDYVRLFPTALARRYGFQDCYSVEQVLATIVAENGNLEFAEYACALFANEAPFAAWVLSEYQRPRVVSKRNRRQSGLQQLLAQQTAPSVNQAQSLYRALRAEVAEVYNGGRTNFIPPAPQSSGSGVEPLRSTPYGRGSGFGWYK
jgi:hypothetical protein